MKRPTEAGNSRSKVGVLLSKRYLMSYLMFMGSFCIYILRANMSVAIVCMTYDDIKENKTDYNNNVTTSPLQEDCPNELSDKKGSHTQGEFDWSRSLRGFILSSFYIGYILTQFIGGLAAKRFGCKLVILIAVGTLVVGNLLTPICARTSVYLLIALQIFKGAMSGLYYPTLYQFWGYWAPPKDRTTLIVISLSGSSIGSVLSSIFSGLLCEHGFDGGWPSIFYLFGIFSFLWCLVWCFFAHGTPASHPGISTEERNYIEESLNNRLDDNKKKKLPVPWFKLLTTLPFYSLLLADIVYSWGWFTALSVLPQYMKDVLKFNMKANGFFNALPYLINFGMAIMASVFVDALIKRKTLSITWTRKLFATLALFPPAIFAIVVAFLNCQHLPLVIVCLSLWVGMLGCGRAGISVNFVDLAPAFAGVLKGSAKTVSMLTGVAAPYLTGVMTPDGKQEQWRNVFLLGAGLLLLGWINYMIFGSGEEQEWAKIAQLESKENCEKDDAQTEMLPKEKVLEETV